jgi:hypothetical protein
VDGGVVQNFIQFKCAPLINLLLTFKILMNFNSSFSRPPSDVLSIFNEQNFSVRTQKKLSNLNFFMKHRWAQFLDKEENMWI